MRDRLKKWLPDLLIVLLLGALPMLLFWQQTVGGATLLPVENLFSWEPYRALASEVGVGRPHNLLLSDLILENYAWKSFAREQLLSGAVPLWQPYILGGAPFLAAGQSSALYPFNILFMIMPVESAYGWYAISQLWVAGLAMYAFARVLGLRRESALISALAYELSGWFLGRMLFTMIIATAVWLPLLLLWIELVIRQAPLLGRPARLPWAAAGAVTLGVAVLGGHAEALYYTLLIAGFYAAARLIAEGIALWREAAPTDRRQALLREVGFCGAWLLVLVGVGLALGMAQLLPTYGLASTSARNINTSLAEIKSFAYPTRHIAAFLMPNVFGSPAHHAYFDLFSREWVPFTVNSFGDPIDNPFWGIKNYVEGSAYMGILPMLLAAVASASLIVTRTAKQDDYRALKHIGGETPARPYRLIFVVLALVSLAVAFGTPLYDALYHTLPFIEQSRAIFRWVWPLTLSVAVLAGFGAELHLRIRGNSQAWHVRVTSIAFAVGGVLLLVGLGLSIPLYGVIEPIVTRLFEGLALAAYAFPSAQAFWSYQAVNLAVLGLVLLGSGGVIALSQRDWNVKGVPIWLAAAVAVIAFDLMIPLRGFYPADDPALLDVTPPSLAWLQDQMAAEGPFRVMAYEDPGADTFNANMGWIHGLHDAAGYDSLIPGQYADYMRTIAEQNDLAYNRIAPIYANSAGSLDSPMLDLLNVRYIITELAINSPKYELAYSDDAVRIYENLGAVPRAFTLPHWSTLRYGEGTEWPTFGEMALAYDVRYHVLIDTAQGSLPEASEACAITEIPGVVGPAAVTGYGARDVVIEVGVGEPSWLIFTDSYADGWTAELRPLDDLEAAPVEMPVRLVNGNFRGVYLPPGMWQVEMRYSPASWGFGWFVTFMAALLLVFGAAVWAWRLAYREEGEAAGIQRVAKNTIAPVLLNLFNKGITFALTFVALRVLGPDGAGEYRYAVVIWGWFEILANFGLNTFLTREVARHKDEANRYLVNTTLLRLMLALIGVPFLLAFMWIRQATVEPALSRDVLITIGVLYGGLFFSTISTGLTALFYAFEKAEVPAAIQTVSAFLTAILGVGALLLGFGIIGLAVVSAIVNGVTLAILAVLTARMFFRPKLAYDPGINREAMGESFPLMLNHLLATLFFRIDVVLLEALKGARVVGWYSVVYTWVDTIGVIPSFFTQALFPVMSRQAHEDRNALRASWESSLKIMSLIVVPVAVLTTLLATPLITVLGGPQYLPYGATALRVFIWAMVIGWLNSVTQYVLIALDRQRTLTVAFVIGAAFNIIANLILIPRYSFVGAAAVTIASEVLLLITFTVVLRQELGAVNPLSAVWRVWLAGLAMAAAAWAGALLSIWLGLAVSLLAYGVMLLLIHPFTPAELERVGLMLPGPLRRMLVRGK